MTLSNDGSHQAVPPGTSPSLHALPDLVCYSSGEAEGVPPYIVWGYEGEMYDSREEGRLRTLERLTGMALRTPWAAL